MPCEVAGCAGTAGAHTDASPRSARLPLLRRLLRFPQTTEPAKPGGIRSSSASQPLWQGAAGGLASPSSWLYWGRENQQHEGL